MVGRDLRTLPKAHLHLHFTGSMRHATLVELAKVHGVRLPDALRDEWPPQLSAADEKGWFRFQRLYDLARSVLKTPDDVYRLVRETAEDEAAEGSGWLEIQVDPSGYGNLFGGITAFTDLVLDAAAVAERRTGVGIAIVIASNRTRHPLDARTLARLAAQYAGRGVVGFGLSRAPRLFTLCPSMSRSLRDVLEEAEELTLNIQLEPDLLGLEELRVHGGDHPRVHLRGGGKPVRRRQGG
jgi:adenosine deaminase